MRLTLAALSLTDEDSSVEGILGDELLYFSMVDDGLVAVGRSVGRLEQRNSDAHQQGRWPMTFCVALSYGSS